MQECSRKLLINVIFFLLLLLKIDTNTIFLTTKKLKKKIKIIRFRIIMIMQHQNIKKVSQDESF